MEDAMLGWVTTFFILTLLAGLMGFAGFTGVFAMVAKFLTVVFVLLFVASIFYSIIVYRNPRVRMPMP
jgi:uncharacterized membrane protein YtjA (UPF0391 family)